MSQYTEEVEAEISACAAACEDRLKEVNAKPHKPISQMIAEHSADLYSHRAFELSEYLMIVP